MTLKELKAGQSCIVETVGGEGALRQHFLDMGILPGAEITIVKFAPMGDPVEVRIHGYELSLRLDDAAQITVRDSVKKAEEDKPEKRKSKVAHPNLGEPGIHHDKKHENPLPDDHVLSFALVGNQNSGKTTLFNRLTGSNQHVGNFPGVTVDRKDGAIIGHEKTVITDLPGIYSMSPYSKEEIVSRDFVLDNKPDAIINIVDSTNIERNLYLTMQLLETERPVVVALNMMDELTGNGGSVDINMMEQILGVPVVPISAAKNQGIGELISHAIHIAKYCEKPLEQDFCAPESPIHSSIHAVEHLIEEKAKSTGLPLRFAACKALEGDELILNQLDLDENEKDLLEHIRVKVEKKSGLDPAAAVADMRFTYIMQLVGSCVTKPVQNKERERSEKVDRILTGKFTAIPIFILIMAAVFFLTFNVIGAGLQWLLEQGIDTLTKWTEKALVAANVNDVIHSLIIDGIFEGVGSVLSFLPIVVVMFFFLSLLEDSGYIARIAFFMDKLLRKIGLSGRSIVPLLIGFGCTVPAVMSTRTLPSDRDRKMTIILTPFMSCTAKLPIYAFFVSSFFPGQGGLVMTGLYLLSIVIGILIAFVYKKLLFKGEAAPFVMELPNYRLPSIRSTLQLMWEKAKDFLQKAFSVILIATVVVWFLQSFDTRFNLVTDSQTSIMALIAGFLAPVMKPLGLGDWRITTSLISGFMAKESVVSVLEVLFGAEGGITAVLGTVEAGTLLIFSLLYTPCVAAIASVKRELGWKWAAALVVWQCILAWIVSFLFRILMLAIGGAL
ncbi:ferrous iron transport protein B [Butyrivibrio sp. AE2032]|uniref:ferrous iron transport protein B n=1 Tax=Butyrivibrio sp. AE2032 TaxID=1458463 RepID=UPI000555C2E2|nr:ferrous iron transport protein B [Butyrivibrio sp. AE2032]